MREQRRCKTAPDQSRAQSLAATRQPALYGADRATKLDGGLLVGLTLDVAKDERRAEARWQTVELSIQNRSDFIRLNPVIPMIVHVDLLQPDPLDRPPAP